ncbi:MAG TPA: TRAP transporter substrate-binding protein DctP [Thermoanaerobaculia bacterium]|jgi:TRAP-type C4-dicarboxylate transport system substrate-binding protein
MQRTYRIPRPGIAATLLALLAPLLAATQLAAPADARVAIKMATLAPDGSVWDDLLREMGAEWQEATGGEVALRIYAGGVAGDEPDVIRKMRIGQLHAASLTIAGLSSLDPAFEIFEIPMFFRSYDELFHVLDEMRPTLEKRLEERGYVLLHWMHGGWVHFFSKKPIRTVDDLRRQKLFVWAGNDDLVQLWRKNGFQPVALAATDVMTGLQTGMVEALPSTPLAALSLQWFQQTPYMQDIGLAPLIGGTVITVKTWNQLSPDQQSKLRKIALATEGRLEKEVPRQDEKAVTQMKQRGLSLVEVPDQKEWRDAAEQFTAYKREQMEAVDLLDTARRLRDAYRQSHGGAGE